MTLIQIRGAFAYQMNEVIGDGEPARVLRLAITLGIQCADCLSVDVEVPQRLVPAEYD